MTEQEYWPVKIRLIEQKIRVNELLLRLLRWADNKQPRPRWNWEQAKAHLAHIALLYPDKPEIWDWERCAPAN